MASDKKSKAWKLSVPSCLAMVFCEVFVFGTWKLEIVTRKSKSQHFDLVVRSLAYLPRYLVFYPIKLSKV